MTDRPIISQFESNIVIKYDTFTDGLSKVQMLSIDYIASTHVGIAKYK